MRCTAALLLALLLAACGQLPRPFAPEHKGDNELLRLGDRAGIVVLPVADDAPGPAAALESALAAALRDLNVPAATEGGNAESRTLACRARVRPAPGGREDAFLNCELRDAGGARVGTHAARRDLPRGAWRAGDPALLRPLIAEAAPAIAALVQNPPVEQAAIPGFPGARLVVLPLEGAPGDGATSLAQALETELLAAKLPVVGRADARDLLVLGDIRLGPPAAGQQEVEITWQVVSAGDDKDLGQVRQRNRVPAGSLSGPWGGTATEVARGAAAGVVDLLRRVAKP